MVLACCASEANSILSMEEEPTSLKPISLSDLIHRRRPVTGASNLPAGDPTPPPKPTPHTSYPQTPNSNSSKILTPLHHPSFLIGTLTLTTPSSSCPNSTCFKFSDHSTPTGVCCDVLHLDLRAINQRIKVLAFNFIPIKPHTGYLEIIRWSLDQVEKSLNFFNAFYLDSVVPTYEQSIVPRCLVYGLLESVSPVTNVPCTGSKSGVKNVKNLDGFLAEVSVCECELCSCRDKVVLQDLIECDKGHSFLKTKVLYFCGSASVWYPVISRLVSGTVVVSGMKKKMVFIGEEKSLMMYVSNEKAVIHIPTGTGRNAMSGRNIVMKQELCNVYTGSITATYMQGMVVELDQKVLLLLTDNQLSMPHSLRIGAIVTVRNFHIEDPKFAWTKVIIFGSCYKTSIRVNVFSPIESGGYQVLQSRSLLRKFIESLQFSARLWVLHVVSSLRKKFAGVLSEMEILGSKHMEGLVQKYSSSCLPLSVFRFRHGVLSEYCLHDLCGCGKETDYNVPKLVVPISNFISQCEHLFIKSLHDLNHQYTSLVCGGKSHEQPISKILKSEDMKIVLLGNLRISEYTGKLQFIDATGSIDVVIPDLPSVWSIKDIYEINDFSVVMEGFQRHPEHLELLNNEPFTCGNIFNHFHLGGRKKINIYVHCYIKDAKSRNHILCPSAEMENNLKDLESGLFHLLLLAHKFPIQRKFSGDYAVSNNLSIYAEAIIIPWNLVVHNKEIDLIESSDGSKLSDHLNYSSGDKRRCDLSCLHEFPCSIEYQVYNDKSMVSLGNLLNCPTAAKKVLLEFKSDSFWKFESLKIGGYYLIKHHYKGLVCTNSEKVIVNSKSHLWNVSFSADVAGPTTAGTIDGWSDIRPDICLHLSADHLSFLDVTLKELKQDLIQPTNSVKMTSASTPFGAFGASLPMGDLLSVQGRVVAIHRSDKSRLSTHLGRQTFHGPHHRIVPGVTNSVCIHVLVDHNIVKICSSLGEHSYPTGFGPGVKANFHRVLLTSEGGVLKLTPASFMEINSITVDEHQCSNKRDFTSVNTSLLTGPAALISEMMRSSEGKKMLLHCKVVSIYVLVLEKNSEFLRSSKVDSEIPCVNFPLAGFIMDDGSSSCCCWTDNKTALTLLSTHSWSPRKRTKRSLHNSNNKKLEVCSNTMSQLGNILNRHGTVVIKNHGSLSDSSCLDAAVSVHSDSVLKESDEQFIKSLIFQACSTNSWNVVGSVLDSEALNRIEEQLQRLDMMMMLPPVNIWVSEVSHLDVLNEARSILKELMKS